MDLEQYFNEEEDLTIEFNESEFKCKSCGVIDGIVNCNIHYVCINCGVVQDTIIFEKWKYQIGVDYISKYTRYGHWKKILRSVQGLLVCSVPYDVIRKLKNERFETIQELKKIMIKKQMRKYYLSIYWIYRQCKNKNLIHFNKMLYNKLLYIFQTISTGFNELVFTDNRKNFFNYHYVLIKILRMLGEEYHIKYLFSMKDNKKIKYSERLFKEICNNSKLEFIAEPIKKKRRKYRKRV